MLYYYAAQRVRSVASAEREKIRSVYIVRRRVEFICDLALSYVHVTALRTLAWR